MTLIRHVRATNQFYGHYHERGIFTWNDTNNNSDLESCINEVNERNPNVQLIITSGYQVHFLDAFIENRNGILHTRVYHEPLVQSFLLPFTMNYPRIFHRQWFQFRLARAMQYCDSFDDFQDECTHIEFTFLANGYSLEFIRYHWSQFFKRFIPRHLFTNLITQFNYSSFRQHIIHYFNGKAFELNREQRLPQVLTIPRSITFFYLYDWGNRTEFNRKFRQSWQTSVLRDGMHLKLDFNILLRAKYCYLSHTFLVRYN